MKTKITELLGIEYPVIQGGMAWVAEASLAAAVSDAGGLGPVSYTHLGGGLKQDNAEMLASIKEIDGGLIALTRFTEEIGFYPEEYLEIINIYMNAVLGQEVVK